MSRFLRLVIALAIAAPTLVSMAGPAVACSCAPVSAKEVVASADAVVAGHVIGEQPIDAMTTHSTVAVDGVYKGKVEATIVLSANIGSGGANSCAVLYPVGSTVDPLVLQRLDDGSYQIAVCAFLSRAAVLQLVGDARPPPAAPSPVTTPPSRSVADVVDGLSWPAVVGGLIVAVVAIAGLFRWSGRRRRAPLSPVQELQATAGKGS